MRRRGRQDLIQETLTRLQESVQQDLRELTRKVTCETVHRTRVAIRRLRAGLHAMKHELSPALRRRCLSALHQFAADLEDAREADIKALSVKELIKKLPAVNPAEARRLQALANVRRFQSRQALRTLAATAAWEKRLVQLERNSCADMIIAPSDTSLLTIREVLAHDQRRLRRALRHIDRSPRELHRLRLRIKGSRYLDEDFGSLLSMSPDRELKSLRQLQNRLGEFHDNWRLKKWLRAQTSCPRIADKLRHKVNAHQTRLRKNIDGLIKDLREEIK
jgi:CHAD domain-containing protein